MRERDYKLFFSLLPLLVFASLFLRLQTSPASADFLQFPSEIRLGIFDHNIEPSHNEKGIDINVELLFGAPFGRQDSVFQDGFFRPRFHLGASINSGDDTSVAYGGFSWTLWRNDWMFLEATFGGALHNGPLLEPGRASYGCHLNFRESGSLGFLIDADWQLLFTVDHMSNGDLCDDNRGLTNAGVRLGYRLGG